MITNSQNTISTSSKQDQIYSILVIDPNGCLLGFHNRENNSLDENLVAMFISALSNFSKELFNKENEGVINVNRGKHTIYLVSNEKLCTAMIGEKISVEYQDKLHKLLNSIDNLYKNEKEPSTVNYENEISYIIQKIFQFS